MDGRWSLLCRRVVETGKNHCKVRRCLCPLAIQASVGWVHSTTEHVSCGLPSRRLSRSNMLAVPVNSWLPVSSTSTLSCFNQDQFCLSRDSRTTESRCLKEGSDVHRCCTCQYASQSMSRRWHRGLSCVATTHVMVCVAVFSSPSRVSSCRSASDRGHTNDDIIRVELPSNQGTVIGRVVAIRGLV